MINRFGLLTKVYYKTKCDVCLIGVNYFFWRTYQFERVGGLVPRLEDPVRCHGKGYEESGF